MSQFKVIKSKDLEKSLLKNRRQYLVGNLSLPQILKHIHSDNIEIGISNYKGGEIEEAHFHPKQTEFMLIIWGDTEYCDVSNDKIYRFKKRDFYCIEPGVKYAQKVLKKTRILFVKTPAVNDKTSCEASEKVKKWLKIKK